MFRTLYKPEQALSKLRGLDECLAELERELGVRSRCYAAWIEEGKLSRVDAADRFERLEGAVKQLRHTMATSELAPPQASVG